MYEAMKCVVHVVVSHYIHHIHLMIMKTHLHRLEDIIVSHPGASLARPLLARLGPDLVEAWHDERSPEKQIENKDD